MGAVSAEELKSRQALPLEYKVMLTQSAIERWYERFDGKVYLSYSGGKDSTVLLDIVKDMYLDVPAVFCDTGLEYPEVRHLALKRADVVIRPKMTFRAVIERYGYPFPSKEQAMYIRQYRHTKSDILRNYRMNGHPENGGFAISKKWRYLCDSPYEFSEQCCGVMKKRPFRAYEKQTGRKPIIGTMAEESRIRFQEYLQHGCNSFDAKRQKSTPMAFWTEQDVLLYLKQNRIEYAACYGKIVETVDGYATTGVKRTGCMFCMFGVAQEKEPNRFQQMQDTYPKQYDYCINKLGIGKVLDYVGIPYEKQPTLFDGEEVMA